MMMTLINPTLTSEVRGVAAHSSYKKVHSKLQAAFLPILDEEEAEVWTTVEWSPRNLIRGTRHLAVELAFFAIVC